MKSRKPALNELFGVNVKLERTRQRLTQEQLAALVKTEQPYLSKVERGLVVPSLEFVERIATALNVSPAALLDESMGRR